MKKRIFVLLLISAMLLSSCGGKTDDNETDNPSGTGETNIGDGTEEQETEPEETVDPSTVFTLPDTNFEGKTVNILATQWYSGVNSPWSNPELAATEITGDQINDAVYNRKITVETKYNVKLNYIAGDPYIASALNEDYIAGTNSYDIAYPRVSEMASIAGNGTAYDLNKTENLDLSKKWWSQLALEDLTINGATFFMAGDISHMDKYCSGCVFFNKTMAAENNITSEELYGLVDSGKWTYDNFRTYTMNVTNDSDGNGVLDNNDTWGCSANADYVSNVMQYWDNPITDVVDGKLIFNCTSEHTVDIVDRMIDMMKNNVIYASSWDMAEPIFTAGRSLFYLEVTQKISNFRSLDMDFGVLPPMKYDESQNGYRTTCASLATMVMVPKTTADRDTAGFILESLAYESNQTVIPAFIDNALETKYARDERTADMLHIIFDGITYDLGLFTDIGGFSSQINSMRSSLENTVSSSVASVSKVVDIQIEQINGYYTNAE